jgi:hypothetical protein
MSIYRERVFPGPWVFIMTLLLIPAALLVFLPINFEAGVVVAIVLYVGCSLFLITVSPLIEVTDEHFVAGRAKLPIADVGEATGYDKKEATIQRGPELDARAWLVIRGWVSPVVKVLVADETDPTPYWLVSTRHPERIVAALAEARARVAG